MYILFIRLSDYKTPETKTNSLKHTLKTLTPLEEPRTNLELHKGPYEPAAWGKRASPTTPHPRARARGASQNSKSPMPS